MNFEHYLTDSSDGKVYSFTSTGVKGNIPKIIQYEKIKGWKINGKDVYNLGFGVLVQKPDGKKIVDDFFKTNNGDRTKILATVGKTVIHFSEQYPDAVIFASGNRPVKNRLYRMMISNSFEEISTSFFVYGRIKGKWESFNVLSNYDAFIVFRK